MIHQDRTPAVLSRYLIELKKDNSLIRTIITRKVTTYESDDLTLYNTYEISVAAGNVYGFGEETIKLFTTLTVDFRSLFKTRLPSLF